VPYFDTNGVLKIKNDRVCVREHCIPVTILCAPSPLPPKKSSIEGFLQNSKRFQKNYKTNVNNKSAMCVNFVGTLQVGSTAPPGFPALKAALETKRAELERRQSAIDARAPLKAEVPLLCYLKTGFKGYPEIIPFFLNSLSFFESISKLNFVLEHYRTTMSLPNE